MQLKNLFKKLFSTPENSEDFPANSPRSILFANEQHQEILSVKFFLLVMAEHSGEKPDYSTIKSFLQTYFQSCSQSKAFDLTSFAHAIIDHLSSAQDKEDEWENIYHHLHLQFENLSKEDQILLLRECTPVALMYKAEETTLALGETFLYRINRMEKCSKLTKEELTAIFEEAGEVVNGAR